MKLSKSPVGKALIILYYTVFLTADVFFMLFIMLTTDSILAGLGVGFILGIGIGVLGGELEFREHCKTRHEKHLRKQEVEESKVIDFRSAPGA